MLGHAFKEWAIICEALARGEQSLILRKGGIAEDDGAFNVDHSQFWLFPTYTHQQRGGIQEHALPLLEAADANRPPAGKLHLQHWVEVVTAYRIREELPALLLSHLHGWSEETVRARFQYRTPGLYVLLVRVHRVPRAHEMDNLSAYEGCKSWVELESPLSVEGSAPVLDDHAFERIHHQVDLLLAPTAYC